jgi:hypothetical protein
MAPLHMVPKKDGSWQPCGNYHHLSLVKTPDKYPLPNMEDLSNSLHGCTIFSKIDLVKGYHQIPVATEEIPKTAIISVIDRKRPDVSGPIQSIKMYSYVQCTMQGRSVCCGDVPCLAHMELGSVPLHPEHLPPPPPLCLG